MVDEALLAIQEAAAEEIVDDEPEKAAQELGEFIVDAVLAPPLTLYLRVVGVGVALAALVVHVIHGLPGGVPVVAPDEVVQVLEVVVQEVVL